MIYENNKKLIPKLRFPEFQTSGEWKTVRLGDLIKEKNIRNKNNLITLVLSVTNKKDGFVIQNEFFGKSIASKNVSNYKIVNKWDFAYNPARINIGSISMLENFEVCIVSPMYVVFSINHEIIYKYFLKYWIQSYNFTGYIKPLLAGSVRNILSFNSMQEMIIQIPSLEEQHRIASFLTSADELIDAERRKLEALKKYKKGLMQKLFPRDGEKIPEMRFPEFQTSGEWEEKQIKDVLTYERPDLYIVEDTNYLDNGIPVLTANKSFILGYTDETDNIYNNLPVIIFDDFTTDKKYVDFPFKVKSSAIKILKSKDGYVLKFIYELLNIIYFNLKEHKRYYISMYQNLTILVPTLPEQQKIAEVLSTADELIGAERRKLEALKKYKKGLMQKLFPNI